MKELRKERDISQRELARRVGIDFLTCQRSRTVGWNPQRGRDPAHRGAFDASADELLVLTYRFPSDLADALKDTVDHGALRRSLAGEFDSLEDPKRALSKSARRKG